MTSFTSFYQLLVLLNLVFTPIRIPGVGGSTIGITPPPPADITVGAFTRAAIVSAFNQCTGNPGGFTIFFPQGTYPISSTIELPSPKCSIFGVRAKSIIDATACGGCYSLHSTNGAMDNGAEIYNLAFESGGINYDYMDGLYIHHNVFHNMRSGYIIGADGGMSSTTIDSNIVYGNPCPSPCGSTAAQFIHVNYEVHFINLTNNWIQNVYEGMSVGGPDGITSDNITVTGNTILGMVRMGIEFLRPRNSSTFSNNYIAQWRTQNETNNPTGHEGEGSYPGQNPIPGCVNYPNGTGNGTQGGGNRYDCDSFGMSIVGYGNNIIVNNNLIYGTPSGPRGPVWGIEFLNRASSQLRNNVIQGLVWNIWDDGTPDARPNYSGNITCGEQDMNPGTGPGNVYRSNCSDGAIPAVQPVPNQPFNPVTGN